jgi:hypothetical protein
LQEPFLVHPRLEHFLTSYVVSYIFSLCIWLMSICALLFTLSALSSEKGIH